MNKVGVCMSKNGRVGFSCIYLPISFYRDVCCCNLMMFYDCRECESLTGIALCYVTGTMTILVIYTSTTEMKPGGGGGSSQRSFYRWSYRPSSPLSFPPPPSSSLSSAFFCFVLFLFLSSPFLLFLFLFGYSLFLVLFLRALDFFPRVSCFVVL